MITYPVPICQVKNGVCALVGIIPIVKSVIKP